MPDKKIDLSQATKIADKSLEQREVPNTEEALLEELNKSDPFLAMLASAVFSQGEVITHLQQEVQILKEKQRVAERHLGHLVSKDDEFKAHFQSGKDNDSHKKS